MHGRSNGSRPLSYIPHVRLHRHRKIFPNKTHSGHAPIEGTVGSSFDEIKFFLLICLISQPPVIFGGSYEYHRLKFFILFIPTDYIPYKTAHQAYIFMAKPPPDPSSGPAARLRRTSGFVFDENLGAGANSLPKVFKYRRVEQDFACGSKKKDTT